MRRSPSINKPRHDPIPGGRGGFISPWKNKEHHRDQVAKSNSMSLQEVWDWFFEERREWWYRHQMPISSSALDELTGCPRAFLHRSSEELFDSPGKFIILGKYIQDIESRSVIFPKQTRGCKAKKLLIPFIVWTRTPTSEYFIYRISLALAWTLFARCSLCGGNKWLPIMMGGKEHVACYGCFPPDQYPSVGATLLQKSLIHEAAKAYY